MKSKQVHSFFRYWYKDLKGFFQKNGRAFWQEMLETQDLVVILAKMASRQPVSEEEKKAVLLQFKDLGKLGLIFSLFMIPGGSIILPLVAKFLPWSLLPTAFQEELKKKVPIGDDFFDQSEEEKIQELERDFSLQIHQEKQRKVIWLSEDLNLALSFQKAQREKNKKNEDEEKKEKTDYPYTLYNLYAVRNRPYFQPLEKQEKAEQSDSQTWKSWKIILDSLEKNLAEQESLLHKLSFWNPEKIQRRIEKSLEKIEKEIHFPLPFQVILLFSFSVFSTKVVFLEEGATLFYLALDSHPLLKEEELDLVLTWELGLLLRFSLRFSDPLFQMGPGTLKETHEKLSSEEHFVNLGIAICLLQDIHGKSDRMFGMSREELSRLRKLSFSHSKEKQSKPFFYSSFQIHEAYLSSQMIRKLLKRYSYLELLYLPTDFLFHSFYKRSNV